MSCPTPRRVSAQQTESPRHAGVFMTFGGLAGPWRLAYGGGSVTHLSEPRAESDLPWDGHNPRKKAGCDEG
jgi:hypothetical protein